MKRQIRTDCDKDLFFISCLRRGPRRRGDRLIDFRKFRVVIFFVPFLVEAGSFEETMSCQAADLAWPDCRSANETVAEQLLVIHSADSLRRICKIFSRTPLCKFHMTALAVKSSPGT